MLNFKHTRLFALIAAVGLAACGPIDRDDINLGGGSNGNGQDSEPEHDVTVQQPVVVDTISISGKVSGDNALENVLVSIGEHQTTTDSEGYYNLDAIQVPESAQLVISYEKEGYANQFRVVPVASKDSAFVSATMARFDYSNTSVDPTQASSHSDIDQRVTLDIPANAFIDPNGENVSVNFVPGDPSDSFERDTFPGDYQATDFESGDIIDLESITFLDITVFDSNGDEISELAAPIDVTVKLPDVFQTGGPRSTDYLPGDTIPWWSLDEETGIWVREDADLSTPDIMDDAELIDQNGVLFAQAQIGHLSSWNVDKPITTHSCIGVRVLENGEPLVDQPVFARGVSYSSLSREAYTNDAGIAYVNVKRSTSQKTETVEVFAKYGGLLIPYEVTDANEGDINEQFVYTPEEQGSTVGGSARNCTLLSNPIDIEVSSLIVTVRREASGDTVESALVYNSLGGAAQTDTLGEVTFTVQTGSPLTVFIPGSVSEDIILTEADLNERLTLVIPNSAPGITDLSITPNQNLYENGARVDMNVSAIDTDGDEIVYTWTASEGDLSVYSSPAVQALWTAPEEGAGTAVITVTATDNMDSNTETLYFPYGSTDSGNTNDFKVYVKNNIEDNRGVANVYVILHGDDLNSVSDFIITGTDGLADFGEIDAETVSYTIAYEDEYSDRFLTTFNQVTPEETVYYTQRESCTDVATIAVTAEEIPAESGWVDTAPYGQVFIMPNAGTASATGINVTTCDLNSNDTLDIMAFANRYEGDYGNIEMGAFGVLQDQQLVDGTTYTVQLSQTPSDFQWESNKTLETLTISIPDIGYSIRKSPEDEDSGVIKWPAALPVESYSLYAQHLGGENHGIDYSETFSTLPSQKTVAFDDLAVREFFYDPLQESFNWSAVTGSPDALSLFISGHDFGITGSSSIYWNMYTAPNSPNLYLPALPDAIASWRSMELPSLIVSLYADDVKAVTGYEAYIEGALTGELAGTGGIQSGWMVENLSQLIIGELPGEGTPNLDAPLSVSSKAAARATSKATQVDHMTGLRALRRK